MEEVKILNDAGQKLAANIHRPESEGIVPAVILLHGLTGYRNEGHIKSLGEQLARQGIGAIRFDTRGFADSEGSLANDYRFTNYLKDLDAVYDYVRKIKWIDPARIGLWGHSMGGMLSVVWAASHPEVKAIVNCEGPTNLNRINRWGIFKVWKAEGLHDKSSLYGEVYIPPAFFADIEPFNAAESALAVSVPTMVVVGLDDEIVWPDDTRSVYESLAGAKELMEVPGMTHEYKRQPEILASVNAKTVDFFKRHL